MCSHSADTINEFERGVKLEVGKKKVQGERKTSEKSQNAIKRFCMNRMFCLDVGFGFFWYQKNDCHV